MMSYAALVKLHLVALMILALLHPPQRSNHALTYSSCGLQVRQPMGQTPHQGVAVARACWLACQALCRLQRTSCWATPSRPRPPQGQFLRLQRCAAAHDTLAAACLHKASPGCPFRSRGSPMSQDLARQQIVLITDT